MDMDVEQWIDDKRDSVGMGWSASKMWRVGGAPLRKGGTMQYFVHTGAGNLQHVDKVGVVAALLTEEKMDLLRPSQGMARQK